MKESSHPPSTPSRSRRPLSDLSTPSFTVPGLVSRPASRSGTATPSSLSSQLRWTRPSLSSTSEHYRSPLAPSLTNTPSARSKKVKSQTGTAPSTVLSTINSERPWICAISENKSAGKEIGIAMLNLDSGRCVLSQFADTPMYGHLINSLTSRACSVVVLPASKKDGLMATLSEAKKVDSLRQTLQQLLQILVVDTSRANFSEDIGNNYLDNLLVNDDDTNESDPTQTESEVSSLRMTRSAIFSTIDGKFYAMCAMGALFKYLEESGARKFDRHSIMIRYEAPEGTVMIDHRTASDLELVKNLVTGSQMGSLLGVLNYCSTPMGLRLLRMNLLQPLAVPSFIEHRLDALEELLGDDKDTFFELRETLKSLGSKKVDFDKVISQLLWPARANPAVDARAVESKLQTVIQIWAILSSLKNDFTALDDTKSHLWQAIQPMLRNKQLQALMSTMQECIEPDLLEGKAKGSLHARNARLLAVKTGHNSILDAARKAYGENTGDALDKCLEYSETYNLPLNPVFSNQATGGYSLELPAAHIQAQNLPQIFINIAKKKGGKTLAMTTIELKKLNRRIFDSATEIFWLSEELVESLRLELLRGVGYLYKASEAIAVLDMMVALCHYAMSAKLVRPRFGQELRFRQGRHPILASRDHASTIPNDTVMSADKHFIMLSGANNSGKTTYLKQVALLFIMVHIGSFVPAEEMILYPVSRILTRLSNHEDAEANLSTFATELRTMSYILEAATENSIVLIDELGRNTSTHEGIGLAHAVSEALIGRGTPTIFATHFLALASTLSPYPAVDCQHFSAGLGAVNGEMKMSFEHRLSAGALTSARYGLAMASACDLPEELLADASELAVTLEEQCRIEAEEEEDIATAVGSAQFCDERTVAIMETLERLQGIVHQGDDGGEMDELRIKLLEEQSRLIQTIDHTFRAAGFPPTAYTGSPTMRMSEQDVEDFSADLNARSEGA